MLFILLILVVSAGFASASSSTGSRPGLSSLPTSFAWEGDSILNGDNAGDFFDYAPSTSLEGADSAGMVMYNTGVTVNNTTSTNITRNATPVKGANETDLLSGYASVGEMVKAQDWEALQRYTAGIKATTQISDPLLSLETQKSNWDKLFTDPVVMSCGGC